MPVKVAGGAKLNRKQRKINHERAKRDMDQRLREYGADFQNNYDFYSFLRGKGFGVVKWGPQPIPVNYGLKKDFTLAHAVMDLVMGMEGVTGKITAPKERSGMGGYALRKGFKRTGYARAPLGYREYDFTYDFRVPREHVKDAEVLVTAFEKKWRFTYGGTERKVGLTVRIFEDPAYTPYRTMIG